MATARAKKRTDPNLGDSASRVVQLRRRINRGQRPGGSTAPFGRLIVIGNGMVSRRLCETLLELGEGQALPELVVFGEETRPAYDRVHLGDVLRGRPADTLLFSPPSWYLSHGILLHLGDQVEHIDRKAQLVISRRGQRLRYDRLVLATGATPVVPTAIADRGDLLVLRTLEDVERLRSQVLPGRTAVVVGGGLLGVETAAALREAGLEVVLVEIGEHLMRRQLDPDMARALARALEGRGVKVVIGHALSTVVREGDRKRVILSGGLEITGDLVIAATGVRARDELGGEDLLRHPQGGYVVDEYMATSDSRVFAIGDCAVVLGRNAGTVLPGYEMADALAATLLGRPRAFRSPSPAVRLKIPGSPLLIAGRCPEQGWTISYAGKRGHRSLHVEDGRLLAAASLGAWADWNRVEQAVTARVRVTDRELKRFGKDGELPLGPPAYTPAPVGPSASPPELIGDSIVCSCNLVSARMLEAAIGGGCRTVAEVTAATRACAGCGSCKPTVLAMLEGLQTAPLVRPMRSLVVVATVALLAALALPLARMQWWRAMLPTPESWDFLGREPVWQQATGFGVLGLFALALLLPLRRRVGGRFAQTGNFWRVMHALVGAGLCLGLLVHTSARMGQGFNLALSIVCLALVLLGAALGMVWRRAPPQTTAAARTFRPLHVALFWPTLTFITVHVLAVYYF